MTEEIVSNPEIEDVSKEADLSTQELQAELNEEAMKDFDGNDDCIEEKEGLTEVKEGNTMETGDSEEKSESKEGYVKNKVEFINIYKLLVIPNVYNYSEAPGQETSINDNDVVGSTKETIEQNSEVRTTFMLYVSNHSTF